MTPADLGALIQRHRYRATCEADLQKAIEHVLTVSGIPFEREVQMTPQDRADFLVFGIVVELKVDGSAPSVTRQLQRYAKHDRVTGVLLVTTRSRHCCMPDTLMGKPVSTVFVGRL